MEFDDTMKNLLLDEKIRLCKKITPNGWLYGIYGTLHEMKEFDKAHNDIKQQTIIPSLTNETINKLLNYMYYNSNDKLNNKKENTKNTKNVEKEQNNTSPYIKKRQLFDKINKELRLENNNHYNLTKNNNIIHINKRITKFRPKLSIHKYKRVICKECGHSCNSHHNGYCFKHYKQHK